MASKRTYTIIWERRDYPEDGELRCTGLSAKVAFSRLIGGIRNSGPIVVKAITPENK